MSKSKNQKPKKKTQKQCDSLLSPIIKKLYPKCLLCGEDTQVAHHFIKKSVNSYLRYYIPNLINLCNKCHFKLHFNDEGLYNGKIALMKGKKWFNDLEEKKRTYKTIKADWIYYNETYERLEKLFML